MRYLLRELQSISHLKGHTHVFSKVTRTIRRDCPTAGYFNFDVLSGVWRIDGPDRRHRPGLFAPVGDIMGAVMGYCLPCFAAGFARGPTVGFYGR